MENSKIKEHISNANNSRLKIISLISLGFSVFALISDFFVQGVWQDEHLYYINRFHQYLPLRDK